jgi:hypothetical protein
MSRTKTHAHIDGKLHTILVVEDHPNDRASHARVHLACGMTVDTHDEDLAKNKRWHKKDAKVATCATCAAVERGDAAPVLEQGFNPPAGRSPIIHAPAGAFATFDPDLLPKKS